MSTIDVENETEKIAGILADQPRLQIEWGEPEWIDGAWEIPLQMAVATLDAATLVDLFAEIGRRVAAQGGFSGSSAQTAPDDLALLDVGDVATKIGIPVASVYELIRLKKMGCVRVSVGSPKGKKRRIKVSPAQLRAFIAANSDAAA